MTSLGITPEYEKDAELFYKEVLSILTGKNLPFVIGGTYAVKFYVDIQRPTKDIDIFCKAGDYPRILRALADGGLQIDVEDERWLARAYKDNFFVDIIFGSIPGIWPIADSWITRARRGDVLGLSVQIAPPEELIVSKAYRLRRSEFDGADVTHIILKEGASLNWKHLLDLMEPSWELLFAHILLFRFSYPSERNVVPIWIMEKFNTLVRDQLHIPVPKDRVTRGPLLSPNQYKVAVEKWGFKNVTDFTFP